MFPNSCTLEITHCLGLTKGNLESAAQLVLERAEAGTSIKRPKVSLPRNFKLGVVSLSRQFLFVYINQFFKYRVVSAFLPKVSAAICNLLLPYSFLIIDNENHYCFFLES